MPKAKSKRPAKKTTARAPAKRPRPAAPKRTPATSRGIDPRIVAAIGFALQDEELAAERADQLQPELSPWTALGRVRAVRTR